MKTKFVYLVILSFVSGSAFGVSMVNAPCLPDSFKPYKDLLQKVNLFPEDNRTILESHFKEFGLTQKEVEQIRSALGEIHCPGTVHNNPAYLTGILVGSKNTLVTNKHALIDDYGVVRDPLSECTFTTQAELSAGLPGHHFTIAKGDNGLADAIKLKNVALGTHDADRPDDDWSVIRLSSAPANAQPFQLPNPPPILHYCKPSEPSTCQMLIGITARDHDIPGVGTSRRGSSVIQSSYLYDLKRAKNDGDIPSRILGNRSALPGDSGGISFLAGNDGFPIRQNGDLIPVGIVAHAALAKYNGKKYDSNNGIRTESAGFDGKLAKAITDISGSQ